MKKVILLLLTTISTFGQVGINTSNPQAVFDIYSTTSGVLIPRLTTIQKNAITNPATSMLVFDSNLNVFNYYNGTNWVGFSTGFIPLTGTESGNPITGNIEILGESNDLAIKWTDSDGVNYNNLYFTEQGLGLQFSDNQDLTINNSIGISSNTNFSESHPTNKNIYTQRSYVDNQNGKLQQLSTTEISAITTPEIGKLYYNTTSKEIVFYNGVEWRKISNSGM